MTNNRLIKRALQRQKAKRALGISVIVHVILTVVYALFFIPSLVQEAEDAIQVDLISEVPRTPIEKKKKFLIPMKEPEPETVKIPETMEEPVIKPRQSDITKEVNVVMHQRSLTVAKMSAQSPTPTPVGIPKKSETPATVPLDSVELSTDADLPNDPKSVLSPTTGGTDVRDGIESGVSRRDTRVKTRGTGQKRTINIQSTRTDKGKGVIGIGKGTGTGTDSGNGSTFSSIIQQLADDIIQSSGGGPIDVVFVVDSSGSMGDNINAVAEHLVEMIDAYKSSEIDYLLGLTTFNADSTGRNRIIVHQLTDDLSSYKGMLYAIVPRGDENALDAINQTLEKCKFRNNTVKHLIVLTDEPFTSLNRLPVERVITLCRNREVYVNVLGEEYAEHKRLAKETGGTWHAVPKDPTLQHTAQNTNTTQKIGQMILRSATNIPTDIILFVDTSKSMERKMSYITQHIDMWLRDWDNSMIDYRVGVVRFRAKGAVNLVNVYNPPQTQSQIHKILHLPCQDNEDLLSAVTEATKRIKTRQNAKTHFIIFTDEPGNSKYPTAGTINFLKDIPVTVSVIGTNDTFQQQVALQTGGIWMVIPDANKINEPYH